METPVKSDDSDWPLSLMLDEVWLRTRRVSVHRLENAGLWMKTDAYNSFLSERACLGKKLKENLLRRVLGEEEYYLLGSEGVFGSNNLRVRSKLPIVLAFGYDLGRVFNTLLNGNDESAIQVAEVSAIFNLGISIFDLLHDEPSELVSLFSSVFDNGTLDYLNESPQAPELIEELSEGITSPELRILLQIISWFFGSLHTIYQKTALDGRSSLSALLSKAYQAEIRSTINSQQQGDSAITVSQSKSTLPFRIILEIARLYTGSSSQQVKINIDKFVEHIGTNFWILDDLADVVDDFRTNAMNSVLIKTRDELGVSSPSDSRVIAALLSGKYIEESVEEVRNALCASFSELASKSETDMRSHTMQESILGYTRHWLG